MSWKELVQTLHFIDSTNSKYSRGGGEEYISGEEGRNIFQRRRRGKYFRDSAGGIYSRGGDIFQGRRGGIYYGDSPGGIYSRGGEIFQKGGGYISEWWIYSKG